MARPVINVHQATITILSVLMSPPESDTTNVPPVPLVVLLVNLQLFAPLAR